MRILGGPCDVGSEPGPHKTGKVGMCVCVCVCVEPIRLLSFGGLEWKWKLTVTPQNVILKQIAINDYKQFFDNFTPPWTPSVYLSPCSWFA